MTEKQIQYRKMLLRKIHEHREYKIRAQYDGWEAYLNELYGVNSSAILTIGELLNLLEIMDGKTDVPVVADGMRVSKKIKRKVDDGATEKQIIAITNLWNSKSNAKTDMSLRNFIDRMFGYKPLHLQDLKKYQATKIINALNNF